MSTPSTTNPLLTLSAISLFTEDVAASKAFYTSVFGAAIGFEDDESCGLQFNNKLIINLLVDSAAGDLVKPAQVAPRNAGHRFQLTVWVEDLEAAIVRLKENNVQFHGPETKPWGMRVVTFEDPSGHSWEIAQKV